MTNQSIDGWGKIHPVIHLAVILSLKTFTLYATKNINTIPEVKHPSGFANQDLPAGFARAK